MKLFRKHLDYLIFGAVMTGLAISVMSISAESSKPAKEDFGYLVPAQYRLVKQVNFDFDRDGVDEIFMAVEPQKIHYGMPGNKPAKILVFAMKNRKWKIVHIYQDNSNEPAYCIGRGGNGASREPVLEVRDINGDGKIEVVVSMSTAGVSDGLIATKVFVYRNGKFADLMGSNLNHSLDGGVCIHKHNICVWTYVWGKDESHADPHLYEAEFFHWTGERYQQKEIYLSKRKGTAGVKDVLDRFKAMK